MVVVVRLVVRRGVVVLRGVVPLAPRFGVALRSARPGVLQSALRGVTPRRGVTAMVSATVASATVASVPAVADAKH